MSTPEISGKCMVSDCPLLASFGPPDSKARMFCAQHRRAGMANVINPTCLHPDCRVQASFGTFLQMRMRCAKHKAEGMVHISKQPIRQYKGCFSRAALGPREDPGT